MSSETILYIVIAAVIAISVAVFMYGYKTKYSGNLRWIFGVLRFVTIFSMLLLLINPKFTSETYRIEKPKLPVLVDNSTSISELEQDNNVSQLLDGLKGNKDLNDKFDVNFYSFGNNFKELDSLSFSEANTNISKALEQTNALFKNEIAPTLLITDGNQTLGADYEFSSQSNKNIIYPIIVGDSTQYKDLRIAQLNTNRYAFLKNEFPVETILVYSGEGSVNTQFVITQGNSTVHRQNISFSETNNTQTISVTLPATSVGLQKYTAQLTPVDNEKNQVNNYKRFAVEVIDQATNVLVVSKIIHPDIGALKKSITSNEQRRFDLKKPQEAAAILNEYQLIVLYQPDRSFSPVYEAVKNLKKNTLTFTGTATDFSYLNSIQPNFTKQVSSQTEEAAATLNPNYGTFAIDDIGFEDFPPLQTLFGGLELKIPHEILLEQTIDGFDSGSAMLATMELDGTRSAIWDGEGFWKWRANSYLKNKDFQAFDQFMGKLVQYLASNKRRSRLEVSSETFYYNNNQIRLSAQYFDKNFVFDKRASLDITVVNTETEERVVFPLLLNNNFYEVDLNSLSAGEYRYTVSIQDENIARSGNFSILDFNVEQQFGNANVRKLKNLATNTGGTTYFINEYEQVISDLLAAEDFKQIQKSEQKVVPLIDWKFLLIIIVIALSTEWFIRKYNGLI